jgi:tetratricopeptide (TPR) repeat protein
MKDQNGTGVKQFRRGTGLVAAAALIAVTAVAYLPAINGDFVWDDDDHVLNNQTLRSAEGLRYIWLDPSATPQYYPLVHTSFWVEYQLWGLATTGYHITNIGLHVVGAVLLWRILLFLSVPGAWLIATIFAINPVQVESVAWITERKNVLSGVFYLSAMLAYLHFALEPKLAGRRRTLLYAAACFLFLFALLSKTVTATLPAALLVLIGWKRGRLRMRDVWPLLPLFAVGVGMGLVTAWIEKYGVGAQGMDWHLSPLDRFLVAGHAIWFYAAKLIWPASLTFIYPRWHLDATDAIQLAYPITAAATLVALWLLRHKIGSGPLVAGLLFVGTLVPALGFFDVFPMRYSFVADHFQYLASIAFIALSVAAGTQLIRKWAPVKNGHVGHIIAIVVIVVLATLTWRQCHVFANQETLWSDTVAKDPTSWMGHTVLGALFGQRGDQVNAERHYREAVRLNPDFGTARLDLGALLANEGRFDEAIPQMREDVRLEPNSLQAYISLGRALLLNGQLQEATYWLRLAMTSWPNDPQARVLLEKALEAQRPQGRPQ